jgi:hypothetical protein
LFCWIGTEGRAVFLKDQYFREARGGLPFQVKQRASIARLKPIAYPWLSNDVFWRVVRF